MRANTPVLLQAALAALSLASASHATNINKHTPSFDEYDLERRDCQIRCPPSNPHKKRVVLPALTQIQNKTTGEWENVIECWAINTVVTPIPDVDNAFRLDWEGGFEAAYQYIFTGDSYMPAHPAPEPSLIIMAAGVGDLRVPSGKCLRVGAGDIFFSVGTHGKQTAWWSQGTVVSDFYFKDGKIPQHEVVAELEDVGQEGGHQEL
ncbi:hypothetical protein VTK56DRAFT_3146 [Thermocarpiscus australiensis]